MSKKILVIDDEDAIRKAFTLSLEDLPCEVTTAASGEEGIKVERDCPHDLILLDLKMPGINGVETLRQLREITSAPVYIVTAFHAEFVSELKEARIARLGFEILRKPLDTDELQMVIKGILGIHEEGSFGSDAPVGIILYVSGSGPRSQNAIENMRGFLDDKFPERHSLEIVDVLKDQAMAECNRVLVTPTAVRIYPPPERRLVGDIKIEAVAQWLGFGE